MDESVFEDVKKTLDENATMKRIYSLPQLVDACKKKGIAEADVLRAMERMHMNAYTYKLGESIICIIE